MSKREVEILLAVQNALYTPAVVTTARTLSHFGEHDLGWLAVAGVGGIVDKTRRREWATLGVATFSAHAASVVIKRIVRRARPHDKRLHIGVKTPSQLSFPSSHATNTAAASVIISRMTGSPWPLLGVPIMMVSRMVLGVHYPTDTLAGAALGAGVAGVASYVEKETR
ncbi:PAP2 superfamily protein [Corynebacterium capitovis DSM 44611]|uniref:phosphatase PAP2 family protein n=1 Tax=Corynebacterium capitovis TaxID=131081 RepID=UPI0003812779|nr:phosphatase PAP2 family protein [Corynebacterium capitovis]WKD58287.1 PAP2 superfamily protein [Corynebacterium capitovis DSM 44611]